MVLGQDKTKPIHVHVARDTPVHVHVKKKHDTKKSSNSQRLSKKTSSSRKSNSRLQKSTPPVAQSVPKPLSWEGPNHRLEILAPQDLQNANSKQILSHERIQSEDENSSSEAYKEKIDSLLEQVGSLRYEVNAARVEKERRKEEQIQAANMGLDRKSAELEDYKSELNNTLCENELLKTSFLDLKDTVEASRTEINQLGNERSNLIKHLLEVEADGHAAAEEVSKLRDTVKRLKQDKQLSSTDAVVISKQRDALLNRLEDFERTNRTLRKFLKQSQRQEQNYTISEFDRRDLLERLHQAEEEVKRQAMELEARDKQVIVLHEQVEADKLQVKSYDELQQTMDATRAHLQNQLKMKEAESNRMAVRMKTLERDLDRQALEMEHTQGLLEATRAKATQEKEALKKATRIQKERAKKSSGTAELLTQEMQQKEAELEAMKQNFNPVKEKCDRLLKEKSLLSLELIKAKKKLEDLTSAVKSVDASIEGNDSIEERISHKLNELQHLQNENQHLKVEMANLETKYSSSQLNLGAKNSQIELEVNQLKNSVSQYESLMGDYKTRAEQYAKECEDLRTRLKQQEKEHRHQLNDQRKTIEKKSSIDKMKLADLENYIERLKKSEEEVKRLSDQLDNRDGLHQSESRLLTEVTQKLDLQTSQLENLRENLSQKQNECHNLQLTVDSLERKVTDLERQNGDLLVMNSKREESITLLQQRLDDQRNDAARLSNQLEMTLTDARRQVDLQKEQNFAKERAAQVRITDLEAQISRSAASLQQSKRAQEEAERRFQSKLRDMRDRLEQANSTTRGMQNYVSFLKSTYSSVFNNTLNPT